SKIEHALAGRAEYVQFICLSQPTDIRGVAHAMKAGAFDCLAKPVDEKALCEAIHGAIEQARKQLTSRIRLQVIQTRLNTLTPREKQVMQYVTSGWLNKQIARDLGISEKTIKVHRGRVM